MKKETKDKIKSIEWIRWFYVIGGAFAIVFGIGLGFLWGQNKNPILGLMMILVIGMGALFFIKGIKYQDAGTILAPEGKFRGKANSLNIYAKKDPETSMPVPARIIFEDVAAPEGYPQRCRNDGKYYYVHIFNLEKQSLTPFNLPDTKFCPPTQLRIPATMQANHAYFRPVPSLFQRIAPWMLVLALAVEIFIGLPVAMG